MLCVTDTIESRIGQRKSREEPCLPIPVLINDLAARHICSIMVSFALPLAAFAHFFLSLGCIDR